jgi:adenosylhomocysteine nucleosidase
MPIVADPMQPQSSAAPWGAAIAAGADAGRLSQPGMTRIGVVTALQVEAECLRRFSGGVMPSSRVSGGSAGRARMGAEQLVAEGVAGLVSFGLAIGLAPVLRPGDVVLADTVVLPAGGTIPTDPTWRADLNRRLAGSGLNLRVARIAGGDELPTSAGAKRRVFQTTFAAALDTESHAVAEVAATSGLPLLVVRAVAEPAEMMRPAIAFAATSADGQTRSLAVVGHLAKRPWEIAAAWRFSKNGRLALDALRRIAAIGPEPFAFAPG